MKIGSVVLSRWVLSLEMLVCFVPLSLLFVAVVSVMAAGTMPMDAAVSYLSAAAVGPLGLAAAFKLIARNRSALSRTTTVILTVTAAWTVVAFCLQATGAHLAITQSWREFVLIAVLPALGVAHMAVIAKSREPIPTAA